MKTGNLKVSCPHKTDPRRALLVVDLDDDLYELHVDGDEVISVLLCEGTEIRFEYCPLDQSPEAVARREAWERAWKDVP